MYVGFTIYITEFVNRLILNGSKISSYIELHANDADTPIFFQSWVKNVSSLEIISVSFPSVIMSFAGYRPV